MGAYKVLGRSKDGRVSNCNALPENRGKGNCKHFEHFNIHESEVKALFLKQQEQEYAEIFGEHKTFNKDELKAHKREERQKNRAYYKRLAAAENSTNYEEFMKDAERVYQDFRHVDMSFVDDFRKEAIKVLQAVEDKTTYPEVLADYLRNSDTEAVRRVREITEGTDIDELSSLLVKTSRSMVSEEKFSANRKSSISRAIMTAVDNNMTPLRYMESVLYFGGKCCYCNKPLSRSTNDATAEHLSPLSPDPGSGQKIGGTKYGNMALCCSSCNSSRQSKEMVSWLRMANMKKENRSYAYGRIRAFREYAGYEEYTQKQSKRINDVINSVKAKDQLLIEELGEEYTSTMRKEYVRGLCESAVAELQEYLRLSRDGQDRQRKHDSQIDK